MNHHSAEFKVGVLKYRYFFQSNFCYIMRTHFIFYLQNQGDMGDVGLTGPHGINGRPGAHGLKGEEGSFYVFE